MRSLKIFALLNLLPIVVLGGGAWALPLRHWFIDSLATLTVLVLLTASVTVFARPALGLRALRWAAWELLVVGSLIVAAFALSLAFLSGIHGSYGAIGVTLMTLVLLLVVPYTLAYPVIQLLWLAREQPAEPSAAVASAPTPAVANAVAELEAAVAPEDAR